MDNLKRMGIFYHVVEAGGFSAAALRTGMAKSAVSKHISILEKEMGVRLLNRTTRQMSLTEAGEDFFQACEKIVNEATEASLRVSGLSEKLTGSLRIACPTALGNDYLVPLIKTFADRHPGLNVELLVNDQVTNIVEEGIDIAIRLGWLNDSGLIARKITECKRLLCASPMYLEKYADISKLEQLVDHQWIIFTLLPTPYRQTIKRNGSQQTIRVNGRFKTNNILTLRSLLRAGAGMSVLAEFLIKDDIKQERLINVLPDYDFGSAGVYAVYPDREYKKAKAQLFINYLNENLDLT